MEKFCFLTPNIFFVSLHFTVFTKPVFCYLSSNKREKKVKKIKIMSASKRLAVIKCNLKQPDIKPITVIQIGLGPIGVRMIS